MARPTRLVTGLAVAAVMLVVVADGVVNDVEVRQPRVAQAARL